jgi:hypothetical protein
MTLAHIEPASVAVVPTTGRVTLTEELGLWREAFEMAQALAPTPFVPKDLRNNPEAVMAAILRSHELGISALHGLSQIHIIEGRPSLAAELMRALVLAQGHEIWVEESTNTRVTLCGQRTGGSHVTKVTWTQDDAKAAGLAGKQNWTKYPRAMLLARATGELCRLAFADVLAGMSYTAEEVEDGFDEFGGKQPELDPPKTGTRKATRTRKAAAPRAPAAAAAPADLPPLPDEEEPIATTARDADPDELVVRRAQQIAMSAKNAGVDHHLVVAAVTNGLKTSAKDVDAAEAQQVIDACKGLADGLLVLVAGAEHPSLQSAPEGGPDAEAVLDWTEPEWKVFAKAQGINANKLLLRARAIAKDLDVDPPGSLADLAGVDVLAEAVHSWALTEGGAS